MSGKKSLLVDKSKMPLAMGIAFVAFTTQFGGGFASGAQIYQYFINYGIWCLLMPLSESAAETCRQSAFCSCRLRSSRHTPSTLR